MLHDQEPETLVAERFADGSEATVCLTVVAQFAGSPAGAVVGESPKWLEPHMENPPPCCGEGFMVELSGRTSRSSDDPISSSPTVGIEVVSSVIEALRR